MDSLYTRVGRVIKKMFRISDFSLFKKNIRKRIGRILYKQKYDADRIVSVMKEMGMREGSLVCIHASMKEFYNYEGTANELITKILEVLGPNGTLMMPAFPKKDLINSSYIFDKSKDPTGAGYLAEAFRHYPGVLRSIDVRHSVCAIGKYAEYLVKDHCSAGDCWGESSPWRRLCQMGGIVFNLGLPREYMGTFIHCIESSLKNENDYWKQFFTKKVEYHYYDDDGSTCSYSSVESDLDRRMRKGKVLRFFNGQDWCIRRISNLEIKAFYLSHCYPKMMELARKGITVYYVPNPRHYSFSEGNNSHI